MFTPIVYIFRKNVFLSFVSQGVENVYRGSAFVGSKVYSIRINDDELISFLDSLDRRERGAYLRNALLFYRRFGSILESINESLLRLNEALENGAAVYAEKEPECGSEDSIDEYVLSSVEDWGVEA